MHWPFRSEIPNPTNIAPAISKSTARSSLRTDNKSNFTSDDKDIHLRLKNLTSLNPGGLIGKKSDSNNRIIPIESDFSLSERQQRIEWNFKTQEGVITYRLPDGLPDGFSLHNKLQKLMKTNTIYLNDRRFWTTLENRFKNLRKVLIYLQKIYSFFII